LLPDEQESPLRRLELAPTAVRRRIALIYLLGSAACGALTLFGGWWLWMSWPALALAMVALNYLAIGPRGFQKGSEGRLSVGARGLLAPYLAGAWINSRLRTRTCPAPAEVMD